jgi:heterodisulfide reductase subunit B
MEMCYKLLEDAKKVGAEAIIVACPLCQANLDMRQQQIAQEHDTEYDLPVLYFTQLMGMAFGLETTSLGLEKHIISARPLLQEKGMWPAT